MKCKKCEQQVQKEERENKIIVSIFSGAYLLLIVTLLVLSTIYNEYGNYSCVYKRSVEDSSEYIYDWWEETEERKKYNDLMSRAIHGCHQIDRKSGILKGNRDGLD